MSTFKTVPTLSLVLLFLQNGMFCIIPVGCYISGISIPWLKNATYMIDTKIICLCKFTVNEIHYLVQWPKHYEGTAQNNSAFFSVDIVLYINKVHNVWMTEEGMDGWINMMKKDFKKIIVKNWREKAVKCEGLH